MIKYLLIFTALVLSGCSDFENFDCRSERVEYIKESIQRHEECRRLESCIFDQGDMYIYDQNKKKLAECEAPRID